MKSKVGFGIKYFGLNTIFLIFLVLMYQQNIIRIQPDYFRFIIASDLLVILFSFSIILPAIGGKSEMFVLQFLILTVLQLLFMLTICAYEVYNWGAKEQFAIIMQLIPFIFLLVVQTSLLYSNIRKKDSTLK
jgi:O-antigen ligase